MARLSLVGAYHRWVGAFRALHGEVGSLDEFYAAAKQLAELEPEERGAELSRLHTLDQQSKLQQNVQTEADDQYPEDIQCEALTNHVIDGHLAG